MESVLTICIPTYNRIETLLSLVANLLECKDCRFNIIVQDNCSTDSTQIELSKISDPRVLVFSNNKNEGFSANLIKSLTHNAGRYVLLCLDKDTIDINKIPEFIDFLEENHPALGYVRLNTSIHQVHLFNHYSVGIDSIKAMAYLSKHPTGYFYQSDILNTEVNKEYFKCIDKYFPFPFEIINAHIAFLYDSYICNSHLVITESTEAAKKIKSYTYNSHNIYFSPTKRIEEFSFYWKDAMTLDLDNKSQENLIASLLHSALFLSTFGFQSAMKNDSVLQHYGLEKKNITTLYMVNVVKAVYSAFLKDTQNVLSDFGRYRMLASESFFWGLRLIYGLLPIKRTVYKCK